MWEKKRCAHERDMVWFCARCEKNDVLENKRLGKILLFPIEFIAMNAKKKWKKAG